MHLHLNPIGGVAGDMFCAALLDCAPNLWPEARDMLAQSGLASESDLGPAPQSAELSGRQLTVKPAEGASRGPRTYADISRWLIQAQLTDRTRELATAAFALLARAEASVHGVDLDDVHFHELGNWDTLTDIVLASWLLERLEIRTISFDPIPLGSGAVQTEHGLLPVPAPATAEILRGRRVTLASGMRGEAVTPTGAALMCLLPEVAELPVAFELRLIGRGFGHRPGTGGRPNCVQALICSDLVQTVAADVGATIIRFDIDDQTPEDLAIGLDRIRDFPGTLSVMHWMGTGKRGRPTFVVEVLAEPRAAEGVAAECLRQTATIGVRMHEAGRRTLSRRFVEVPDAVPYTTKVVERLGAQTAKIEARDLEALDSYAARRRAANHAESAATQGSTR